MVRNSGRKSCSKGRKQPGRGGGGAADWPDADLAAGEAQEPAPVHDGAHGGGDGRAPDFDCDVSGSGAGGAGGFAGWREREEGKEKGVT